MLDDIPDYVIALIVAIVCIVCIVVVGLLLRSEDHDWQAYAAAHHCVAKGIKEGEYSPVFGGRGGFTLPPDQTIYVCDGGEIRIR